MMILLSNFYYQKTIDFALNKVLWMMNNQLSLKNKKDFFASCLKEIINPIKKSLFPGCESKIHILKMA